VRGIGDERRRWERGRDGGGGGEVRGETKRGGLGRGEGEGI